ncbi:MAG: hypothetical protein JSW61_14560 [Candidatus Thorarchaeota archaeon]|nr:MAG: hypothetical protein JSW61_14560 [Candidatus Thorarchaeota archaeon]
MTYLRRDDREVSERPVRLERAEGVIVIDGRAYPAREVVEALAQSGYTELRAIGDSLVLGHRRITPIFKSRQDRAMASLCHGSLAFCCPESKRCAERDRALEIMGLTLEQYHDLKGEAHSRFIDLAKGLSSNDSITGRVATRPAVDPGYGADDYRRDFDALDQALQSGRNDSRTSSDAWYESRDEHRVDWGTSPTRPQARGYREMRASGTLADEMRAGVDEAAASTACRMQTEEVVDGLASLFAQGELSPFNDDTERETTRPSFCFACGRTISQDDRVCPFCGSMQ